MEIKRLKILSFNLNVLPGLSLVSTGDHAYPDARITEFLSELSTLESQRNGYDIVLLQVKVFFLVLVLPH